VNSTELLPCSSTHIDSAEIIKVEGREEAQPGPRKEEKKRERRRENIRRGGLKMKGKRVTQV